MLATADDHQIEIDSATDADTDGIDQHVRSLIELGQRPDGDKPEGGCRMTDRARLGHAGRVRQFDARIVRGEGTFRGRIPKLQGVFRNVSSRAGPGTLAPQLAWEPPAKERVNGCLTAPGAKTSYGSPTTSTP